MTDELVSAVRMLDKTQVAHLQRCGAALRAADQPLFAKEAYVKIGDFKVMCVYVCVWLLYVCVCVCVCIRALRAADQPLFAKEAYVKIGDFKVMCVFMYVYIYVYM